ncbi:MAG: DNA alkylation repair protein [Myxococcaceae bacterium]|nr:DNA alkylation repair protein [Myxococcaceae bacterium]
MQAYMKSPLPYAGVPMAQVRAITRTLFQDLTFVSRAQWERTVLGLFRGAVYREEWYAAVAVSGMRAARPFQTPEAMRVYGPIIVESAWWDVVDEVAEHRVAGILASHPEPMKRLLRQWSTDPDLWRRRTAIIAQRSFREDTDEALLFDCILPSIDSPEFFLRKAIGWALREYSMVAPAAVKRFVKQHEDRLSGLSKREALRHLAG